MRRLLLATAVLALTAVPRPAEAARFAVGLERGASVSAVAASLERATGNPVARDLAPMGALIVEAPSKRRLARLSGVAYVERLEASRHVAFAPNDPLASRQWHLQHTHAFDAWPDVPLLAPVRVAIIDSGIDGDHPEFANRVVASKSFVGGDALTDQHGHGTFVAGLVAANLNNGQGVAGIAFPAELVIAKVVRSDRSISLETEARAIRWALDQGARVINLSLGGVRDPLDPRRDTFSPLEAAAISYAYRKGAVLVAAVGNADQAPRRPWPYASYPAALPHVIGVSALARDGSVPIFSNRDRIYNDIAAPGQDLLSTFPRALTALQPTCKNQGYSDCGSEEYRRAEGTSFAAPMVTATAALVLSANPLLTPDQVMQLITRTGQDLNTASGCRSCPAGRDAFSGWGRLDVAAAVGQALRGVAPEADRLEPNDDAGSRAQRLFGRKGKTLRATIDFWDDQNDVYKIRVKAGERVVASLRGPSDVRLFLWRPGTEHVEGPLGIVLPRKRVAQSVQRGSVQQFGYTNRGQSDWYYLQVKIVSPSPGSGPYTLSYSKR